MLLEGDLDSDIVAVDSSGNNNHLLFEFDAAQTDDGRLDVSNGWASLGPINFGNSLLTAGT